MRLSEEQKEIIKTITAEVFGNGAEVYLFGSRVDDARRGGDIDLLVRSGFDSSRAFQFSITALAKLNARLGEQKIDLITAGFNDLHRPIVAEALAKGVKL